MQQNSPVRSTSGTSSNFCNGGLQLPRLRPTPTVRYSGSRSEELRMALSWRRLVRHEPGETFSEGSTGCFSADFKNSMVLPRAALTVHQLIGRVFCSVVDRRRVKNNIFSSGHICMIPFQISRFLVLANPGYDFRCLRVQRRERQRFAS